MFHERGRGVVRPKTVFAIIIVSFVLALFFCETYFRFFYFPKHFPPFYDTDGNKTTMFKADPIIGWVNKPGVYTQASPFADDPPIVVTIRDDGGRQTGTSDMVNPTGRIIMVGGSWTFGQSLSDSQTMAWKLSHMLTGTQVLNYGVTGYGTYQSFLMLERVLPGFDDVDVVVYGFMPHHIDRNVAPRYWKGALNIFNRPGRRALIPYVSLGQGNRLICHLPEPFTPWFLGRYLVTFRVVEDAVQKVLFHYSNNTEKHTIMQLLLLKMRNLCREHGCRFVVAMLSGTGKTEHLYSRFCQANNIPCIIFDIDGSNVGILINPRDHHPTEALTTIWARQLALFLPKLMDDRQKQKTDP